MTNPDAKAVKDAQAAAAKEGAKQEKSREETEAVVKDSPYEDYDFMSLADLQKLADERGVTINPDVLKAHLITELRAHQSGATSVSRARAV